MTGAICIACARDEFDLPDPPPPFPPPGREWKTCSRCGEGAYSGLTVIQKGAQEHLVLPDEEHG